MKLLRIAATLALAAAAAGAQAQRAPVPVVDFEDVPVAQATSARLSPALVRLAFTAAGGSNGWTIKPDGDGRLEATYAVRDQKIVVTVVYDADKYSVRYKDSVNMNYQKREPDGVYGAPHAKQMEAHALKAQRERFQDRPETPYGRSTPLVMISPNYELWVRDLLNGVRFALQMAAAMQEEMRKEPAS